MIKKLKILKNLFNISKRKNYLQKELIFTICLFSLIGVSITGCLNFLGSNSSSSPQIAAYIANGSNCTNLTGGARCVINLIVNKNGNDDAILGYTPSDNEIPAITTNSGFKEAIENCNRILKSGTGEQICNILINYATQGIATVEKVAFTLGGTTSDYITVSGN